MISIVSATRHDRQAFVSSPLGLSLRRMQTSRPLLWQIAYSNIRGLPAVYNDAIDGARPDDILVFVHDDVWIDDFFLPARVIDGLDRFQVIGVAGNSEIPGDHVGWAFRDGLESCEKSMLRGAVAHGNAPFAPVSSFGPSPAACGMMDGVFLAARASTLLDGGVRFDPQFEFHFYDMDFCRSAARAGLSLGVWPIAITHRSQGSFGSPAWRAALEMYRKKWPTKA